MVWCDYERNVIIELLVVSSLIDYGFEVDITGQTKEFETGVEGWFH